MCLFATEDVWLKTEETHWSVPLTSPHGPRQDTIYPTNAAPISHPKVQLATLLRISLMLPSSRSNESVEESARHSIEICKNEDTLLRSQEPRIQVT